MNPLVTYLTILQNKVFKLLPMREAYDSGEDNHLHEYLENLCANYVGASVCFPELSNNPMIIEAQNNIAFLARKPDIAFKKWRSLVLRSTRLIHSAIEKYESEV